MLRHGQAFEGPRARPGSRQAASQRSATSCAATSGRRAAISGTRDTRSDRRPFALTIALGDPVGPRFLGSGPAGISRLVEDGAAMSPLPRITSLLFGIAVFTCAPP